MARTTIYIKSLLGKHIPQKTDSIIKQQHEADLEEQGPIDVVSETKEKAKETIKGRSKSEGAGRQVQEPEEVQDGNETGNVDLDGNGDGDLQELERQRQEETEEKQAQERVEQEEQLELDNENEHVGAEVDEERERANGDVDNGNAEEGALRDEARDQAGHQGFAADNAWKAVVLVVLVPIAIGLVLYNSDLSSPPETFKVFNSSYDQVQADFPGQTSRFWRILRNTATAHLKNPNHKKPLVIMFTAGPSAHNVLECIARKLAQTLIPDHNGLGHIESTEYLKYSSLDDAKKNLDEKLKERLEKGRAVMVSNVDQLPVQSPLLFYDYCDNENAPFKQAAIIFTVRLPIEPDPSLEPAKAEGLVEKYLLETWGEQDYIRPDDIPPVVSRMTDNVVLVKEESNETIERNCTTINK